MTEIRVIEVQGDRGAVVRPLSSILATLQAIRRDGERAVVRDRYYLSLAEQALAREIDGNGSRVEAELLAQCALYELARGTDATHAHHAGLWFCVPQHGARRDLAIEQLHARTSRALEQETS